MPDMGPPKKTPRTPAEKIRAATSTDDLDEDQEVDLWEGSYSHKAMVGNILMLATIWLVSLIAIVAVGALRSNGLVWLIYVLVILVSGVGLVGLYFYRKWNRSYQLTNQRFKHRLGILTRVWDRVELIDIDDVRVKQGPIQAMFGVGEIMVRSSDTSHPELTLHGIDRVREIADVIDDARRAERRKRGIHIEAV